MGKLPDRETIDLTQDAAYEAMAMADVTPRDVDGIIGSTGTDMVGASELGEKLGLMPGMQFGSAPSIGGSSHVQSLAQATQVVTSGFCEYVLVVAAGRLATGAGSDATVEGLAGGAGHSEFESPYGPLIPSMYALAARKHMAEFGTTPDQLARVASIAYDHASLQRDNRTQIHEGKTVEEILGGPLVASPLTRDQCSVISDGGAAVLITGGENARANHDRPVEITGVAEHDTHETIHQMPNLTTTGAEQAGREALQIADTDIDAIDVIQIYDCFTNVPIVVLEDLGFCEKGAGGEFVESGALELGGRWPMNTHGGLLAQAHPGRSGGLMHITEAVRQLRGEAESTQVEDARTALVHGNGGVLSTHAVGILEAQ
jgi:acetyl-CoA acetyltransferase